MRRRLELSTLSAGWGGVPPQASAGPPRGTRAQQVNLCYQAVLSAPVCGTPSTLVWQTERRGAATQSTTEEGADSHVGAERAHPCLGHTKGRCRRPGSACRGFLPYTWQEPALTSGAVNSSPSGRSQKERKAKGNGQKPGPGRLQVVLKFHCFSLQALQLKDCWDFPGGAVVKTLRSQCRGPGFDP